MKISDKKKPAPKTGLIRIWKAFLYSCSGLRHALNNETSFTQEFCIYTVLLIVLYFMPISLLFKIVLIFGSTSVLIVELLNSAIESIVDKVSPEYNDFAKQAKDMGSAAVFLAMLVVIFAWICAVITII